MLLLIFSCGLFGTISADSEPQQVVLKGFKSVADEETEVCAQMNSKPKAEQKKIEYKQFRPFDNYLDPKNEFQNDETTKILLRKLVHFDRGNFNQEFSFEEIHSIIQYGFAQSLLNYTEMIQKIVQCFLYETNFYKNLLFIHLKKIYLSKELEMSNNLTKKIFSAIWSYDIDQYDMLRQTIQKEYENENPSSNYCLLNWELYFQNFLYHLSNDYTIRIKFPVWDFNFDFKNFDDREVLIVNRQFILNIQLLEIFSKCYIIFTKTFGSNRFLSDLIHKNFSLKEITIDLTNSLRYEIQNYNYITIYFLTSFFKLFDLIRKDQKLTLVFDKIRFHLLRSKFQKQKIFIDHSNMDLKEQNLFEYFKLKNILGSIKRYQSRKRYRTINQSTQSILAQKLKPDDNIFRLMFDSMRFEDTTLAKKSYFSEWKYRSIIICKRSSFNHWPIQREENAIRIRSNEEPLTIETQLLIEESASFIDIFNLFFGIDAFLLIIGRADTLKVQLVPALIGIFRKDFLLLKFNSKIQQNDIDWIEKENSHLQNIQYTYKTQQIQLTTISIHAAEIYFYFLDSILLKNHDDMFNELIFFPYDILIIDSVDIYLTKNVKTEARQTRLLNAHIYRMENLDICPIKYEVLTINAREINFNLIYTHVYTDLHLDLKSRSTVYVFSTRLHNSTLIMNDANEIHIRNSDGIFMIEHIIKFRMVNQHLQNEELLIINRKAGIFKAIGLIFEMSFCIEYSNIVIDQSYFEGINYLNLKENFECLSIEASIGTFEFTGEIFLGVKKLQVRKESYVLFQNRIDGMKKLNLMNLSVNQFEIDNTHNYIYDIQNCDYITDSEMDTKNKGQYIPSYIF